MRELGCFEIEFTGGEVFYRDDSIEIIKRAREMYFNVSIFSNVSLLNENKIKELSKLYISQISCTIFSLDEKTHDSITGVKGSLKKAMENIILIKKYNIPLEIKTILMKSNYDSYKNLRLFCKENGFKYLATTNIFPKRNGDFSNSKLLIDNEKLREILPEIDVIRKFKKRNRKSEDYICNSIRNSIAIDCFGKVYPCNLMQIEVGNIFEESLKYIWNNSKELKRIKEMKWKDLYKCNSCNKKEFCNRCSGIALAESGSLLDKTNLECDIAGLRYNQSLKN